MVLLDIKGKIAARKQKKLDRIHEKMIAEVESRLDPPITPPVNWGASTILVSSGLVTLNGFGGGWGRQSVTVQKNQTLQDVLDNTAAGNKV